MRGSSHDNRQIRMGEVDDVPKCKMEILVGDYMEALLRSALLLTDLRRASPIREIVIASYRMGEGERILRTRCRIIPAAVDFTHSSQADDAESVPEEYLILYPD